MNEIEVLQYLGEGYQPLVDFNGWRVAAINFKPSLTPDNFKSMERHLDTDEVFIPIKGENTLFIGDSQKRYDLEIGKLYNVKKGVWHHLCMSEDAFLVVVENSDTSNSEMRYYDEVQTGC